MQSNKIEPIDAIDDSKNEKIVEASALLPQDDGAAVGSTANPGAGNVDVAGLITSNLVEAGTIAESALNSSDDEEVTEIPHHAVKAAATEKFQKGASGGIDCLKKEQTSFLKEPEWLFDDIKQQDTTEEYDADFLCMGEDQINERYSGEAENFVDLKLDMFKGRPDERTLAALVGSNTLIFIRGHENADKKIVQELRKVKLNGTSHEHEDHRKLKDEQFDEGLLPFTHEEVQAITFLKGANYNSNYLLIGFNSGRIVIYDIRRRLKELDMSVLEKETDGIQVVHINFVAMLYGLVAVTLKSGKVKAFVIEVVSRDSTQISGNICNKCSRDWPEDKKYCTMFCKDSKSIPRPDHVMKTIKGRGFETLRESWKEGDGRRYPKFMEGKKMLFLGVQSAWNKITLVDIESVCMKKWSGMEGEEMDTTNGTVQAAKIVLSEVDLAPMFEEDNIAKTEKYGVDMDYRVIGFKLNKQKLVVYSKKHMANFNIERQHTMSDFAKFRKVARQKAEQAAEDNGTVADEAAKIGDDESDHEDDDDLNFKFSYKLMGSRYFKDETVVKIECAGDLLIVCSTEKVQTYRLNDRMSVSKHKPLEDTAEGTIFELNGARLSPCGRILVESQNTRLIIRDTISFREAYKYEGNSKILLLSSNFCLFEGKDDQDQSILGIINFQNNKRFAQANVMESAELPVGLLCSDPASCVISTAHAPDSQGHFDLYAMTKGYRQFSNATTGQEHWLGNGYGYPPKQLPQIFDGHAYFLVPNVKHGQECCYRTKYPRKYKYTKEGNKYPIYPECILIRKRLGQVEGAKSASGHKVSGVKRYGIDCDYSKGFKMIMSEGRHLVLCSTRIKKDLTDEEEELKHQQQQEAGVTSVKRSKHMEFQVMIHELPVRKINYKDPVTKQPNRWAYKNPDYEEFYKHHEIDNMAMPIFRAFNYQYFVKNKFAKVGNNLSPEHFQFDSKGERFSLIFFNNDVQMQCLMGQVPTKKQVAEWQTKNKEGATQPMLNDLWNESDDFDSTMLGLRCKAIGDKHNGKYVLRHEPQNFRKVYDQDVLISPSFQVGISYKHASLDSIQLVTYKDTLKFEEQPDGNHVIKLEEESNRVFDLMPMKEKVLVHGKLVCFFSWDSRFVGILKQDEYVIYRTKDGSVIAELSDKSFKPILINTLGGHQVVTGFLDMKSRKYMAWSIEALINLGEGKLNLFPADFSDQEMASRQKSYKKNQILGQPFPALYPQLLSKLEQDVDDASHLDSMHQYTIGPEYYNTVHYLSLMNNGALVQAAVKGLKGKVRYFSLENSPLLISEPATGQKLMEFLLLPTNESIVTRLTQEELEHIVDLPCNIQFFEGLSIIDEYYTEKRTLQPGGEFPFSYIKHLSEMKQRCDVDQKVMMKELFVLANDDNVSEKQKAKKSETDKPITVNKSLVQLPLLVGTPESCDFHMKLYKCSDREIFSTELIQNFVKFKAANSIPAFWAYFAPYIIYMSFLAYGYYHPHMFTVFFCWQSFELFGGIILSADRIRPVWAIMDIFRLISMLLFILANYFFQADHFTQTQFLTIANFFSWITVVKYMRRLSGVREFITLVRVALVYMFYFLFIILVFFLGFATSLRIKPLEINSPDHFGGQNEQQSLLNQYALLFGDFGSWDDFQFAEIGPNWLDYVFFLTISIVGTLILFNLIVSIFSEAYGDLKEVRVAVDIEQLNEIQSDVEFFVRLVKIIFCQGRKIKKENQKFASRLMKFPSQHLVYAQYQTSIVQDEPDFAEMINNVNKRFDKADEDYAQLNTIVDKICSSMTNKIENADPEKKRMKDEAKYVNMLASMGPPPPANM